MYPGGGGEAVTPGWSGMYPGGGREGGRGGSLVILARCGVPGALGAVVYFVVSNVSGLSQLTTIYFLTFNLY